jgi:hypothetical protein
MDSKNRPRKKGISTFIATLLLIVLVVAAGVLIYAYTMGYLGGFSPKSGNPALQVQSTAEVGGTLHIYAKNIGSGTVKLDPNALYINDKPVSGSSFTTNPSGYEIPEGVTCDIMIQESGLDSSLNGKTNTIKIVSIGGTFALVSTKINNAGGPVGPLDHFTFTGIGTQAPGVPFTVIITAVDASGNTISSYTSTNTLTLTPATGTITPATTGSFTAGVWSSQVTLSQSATGIRIDTSGDGKSGSSNTFNVNPVAPVLDHFEFAVIGDQTVSVSFSITITAKDASENTVTGYTGTNTLSDTAGTITPISTGTFVGGVWSGPVTISSTGTNVAVTTNGGGKSGISNTFNVVSATAPKLEYIVGGQSLVAGTMSTMVTVQRQSAGGTPLTIGDITVNLATTSFGKFYSDAGGLSQITSLAISNGQNSANFYYKDTTAGTPTLTSSSTGFTSATTQFNIGAAAALNLQVTAPSAVNAGASFTVTVTALDQYGNTATGYTGIVQFTLTPSDAGATLPSDYMFLVSDNGVKTFTNGFTLAKAGLPTITATDTVTPSITGSASVTVNPGAAAVSLLVDAPATATAGAPFTVTVTALDQYGNTFPSYTGTVHFTSSDTAIGIVIPSDYTFLISDNSVKVFTNGFTLKTTPSQMITVTDTVTSSITGFDTVTVNPAAAATLTVTGFPSSVTTGTAGSVTVTAKDAYGNTATGYIEIIYFTSSDSTATLPSNYQFLVSDNAFHTFTNGVTLKTVGTQSITATDTVTSSITGSQTGITVNPAAVSITFTTSGGIVSDASGTVLTIDGTTYSYSTLPHTFTWTSGSTHSVTATTPVGAGSGKQYRWNNWTNSGGLTVNGGSSGQPGGTYTVPSSTTTVTANYVTQWQVTFDASTNVKGDSSVTIVTVSGSGKTGAQLPFAAWYDSGSSLTYSFSGPVASSSSPSNTQYVWSSSGGLSQTLQSNSFTVSASGTVTGTYTTQYQLTVTASAGAVTFSVTYTQGGTAHTTEPHTTTWSGWTDAGTTATVSSPQSPFNGLTFNSYNPSASVTMNAANSITLVYSGTFGLTSTGSTSYPTSTVGQTTQLGSTAEAQGTLSAQKITIPAGGATIKSVNIRWSTIGAGGQVRFAFYTDSGGNPDSLVSGSDTGVVTAVAGLQTITYSNPFYLNGGTYWLARQTSNKEIKRYYATTGGPGRRSLTFSWGAFPSSFGTPTTSDNLDETQYVTYVQIEGYAKATKATLSNNNANIRSVSFYSHATGNFRLAIYSDSSGPSSKLWESSSTAATAGLWNTVNITPGTLTLNSGTYWLVWQWDSVNSGPSFYTPGAAGDGNYRNQPYGGFPAPWTGGTSSSEKWSIYATYTLP